MRPLISRLIVGLAILSALASTKAYAQEKDCNGFDDLSPEAGIRLGKVTARPRVNFVKSASEDKACPSDTAACRDKAYLVTGNEVILSGPAASFICAGYVGAKGDLRVGWLPAASVSAISAPVPGLSDWVGSWKHSEANIDIKAAAGGRLAVSGNATYGALDPDRMKRGAVNEGEISGEASPQGATLAFAMGANGTIPFDKAGEDDCKVMLLRVGRYLLAKDNNMCGGLNVSFTGAYLRGRSP